MFAELDHFSLFLRIQGKFEKIETITILKFLRKMLFSQVKYSTASEQPGFLLFTLQTETFKNHQENREN